MLFIKVKQVEEELQSLVGTKGKTQAKHTAEALFDEYNLHYAKGIRESFTHYYLSNDSEPGSISIFISYNSRGVVTDVKRY